MKILIIRHCEPDYSIDSLTQKGFVEADLLAKRISQMDIKAFYCSPLGRAQATAKPTLEAMGRTAETLDWLREFHAPIHRPDRPQRESVTWDWLPAEWTAQDCFYSMEDWTTHPVMQEGDVKAEFDRVCAGLDELVEKHGYKREGRLYKAISPNEETIVLFCHFGLECVLLSRLLNIPPMPLWHGFCAAPGSVTCVNTEERRPGIVSFRVSTFGDTSHYYAEGEPISPHARFCETYENGRVD